MTEEMLKLPSNIRFISPNVYIWCGGGDKFHFPSEVTSQDFLLFWVHLGITCVWKNIPQPSDEKKSLG